MFCRQCGTKLSDDNGFCPQCGYKLASNSAGSFFPERVNQDNTGSEEIERFKKRRASYHPNLHCRNTGVFVVTNTYVMFSPHLFSKPFRIELQEIAAVSDAYSFYFNTFFNIETKDGKTYIFSLNYLDLHKTQAVADMIKEQIVF